MICPKCGCRDSTITKEIRKTNKNFRFRKCKKCHRDFRTIEYYAERKDYKQRYIIMARKLNSLVKEVNERGKVDW